jgi:predicted AlkP superfamily phosphohydrolase/phosphomutase
VQWRRGRGVGSVAALALTLLVACGQGPALRGRVLLIGIDGAAPRITRPLLEQGRLPNLERIARAGEFGPLRSHFPLSSPRVWTSIATGKMPEKHGILGFAYQDDEGVQRLFLSVHRTAHALWNIASDAGLTVGVVNWWNTYPLEKIRGVMVSDHLLPMEVRGRHRMTGAAPAEASAIVYPDEWGDRVAALVADDSRLTDIDDPFRDRESFPSWSAPDRLSERFHNDEDLGRIALEIERELQPDLMMVLLPGIDRVSHHIWASIEPESAYEKLPSMSASERRAAARALYRYYEFTDAVIGRLAHTYGPDDLIMVVSDHGFEAGRGLGFLTGVHETEKALYGVFFASGPDIASPGRGRRRPTSVNDVTPTILAWLGLPVAADMEGRVASFLQVAGAERIATYDTRPVERLGASPSGAEGEILEQLKALGYLEDGDAD